MRISFYNFIQHFVRNVFVTDDVLLSINAPELIEFTNKIDQLDYHQHQEAALDRVLKEIITLGISIIEHNDLFFGAYCNNEYHLSRFQFKEEDAEFVSSEELARELGYNFTPPCLQLSYETDRQAAKQRILKRHFAEWVKSKHGKLQVYKYIFMIYYKSIKFIIKKFFHYLLKVMEWITSSNQNGARSQIRWA